MSKNTKKIMLPPDTIAKLEMYLKDMQKVFKIERDEYIATLINVYGLAFAYCLVSQEQGKLRSVKIEVQETGDNGKTKINEVPIYLPKKERINPISLDFINDQKQSAVLENKKDEKIKKSLTTETVNLQIPDVFKESKDGPSLFTKTNEESGIGENS